VANREPNRVDFLYAEPSNAPQPERLQNVELGFDYTKAKVRMQTNFFYMYYTNQLVLTGRLDAVGNPIRENIGQSYRTGIEIIGTWQPLPKWRWDANVTLSQHRNVDFVVKDDIGEPTNLGNTNIAFAPAVIGASNITWQATQNFNVSLFSKYVGEQFLSNEQNNRHKLPAYFLNDLRFNYVFQGKKTPQVRLYVHLQNLLDVKYANNGYVYFGDPYFYAQAGRNFLMGAQIDF
jgi:iron complex outermembrane receptor protein